MANIRSHTARWLLVLSTASSFLMTPSTSVSEDKLANPAVEVISVRTKKYNTDYEFPNQPDFSQGIVDQATYNRFLSLPPEKQKTFFANRKRLLTKIASGLTNPAVANALYGAEQMKSGLAQLRDRIKGIDTQEPKNESPAFEAPPESPELPMSK